MPRYRAEDWPDYEHRGRWQLFEKIRGAWVGIGRPMRRDDAKARLTLRIAELGPNAFQQIQPHIVPL